MASLLLTENLAFDPVRPEEALRQLPSRKAVFALYGEDEKAEPYIGLTPDLRRRLERLLRPAKGQTKRLQLVSRVRRIAWRLTGSEFESLLLQFSLLESVYGAKALERMHLRPPAFVKFHGSNRFPHVTITNRRGQREGQWAFGPFPSRAAAERYADELLKLFLLRRCEENLDPSPSHPGCVYGEMKMCLAPCQVACTDARYAEEAEAVRSFLATRGESRLVTIQRQRDKASEDLEFEDAARLHAQVEKIEAVRALASELVHPMSELRAAVLQTSAASDEVSVFLFEDGVFHGPEPFSTIGMRIQNEQSGSSSLYAQPMAVQPVPEQGAMTKASRDVLEARMESVLDALGSEDSTVNTTLRQGHLALLARWYYRPQQKRAGEICFADAEGKWPLRSMMRSVGRVAGSNLPKPTPPAK
ncbi:UvrB/UvrC motif-containing protein [Acidicapsa dinghuensis]|uniref:UvrB/UvrC motif-containing protein n=1 Tax=Acidicapsa dinghuensis TaxID=2218256 RepID=A0ABW1EFT5_9BACT|nr:UvrB/UvrC motif-containing protein [Acidicapsa dinghuensis]